MNCCASISNHTNSYLSQFFREIMFVKVSGLISQSQWCHLKEKVSAYFKSLVCKKRNMTKANRSVKFCEIQAREETSFSRKCIMHVL